MNQINLDKEVENILQRPLVHNMPLYLRVDGSIDVHDYKEMNVDKSWIDEANKRCTSPDNVKRVFITTNGVNKHLFIPIGTDGNLENCAKYSDDVQNSLNINKQAFNNGITQNDIRKMKIMRKELNGCSVIQGYGFGALQKEHVYQNVEEVYIDKSLYLGFGTKIDCDFNALISQTSHTKYALQHAFISENTVTPKEFYNRFKRLHVLAYIENLELAYSFVKTSYTNINRYDYWINALLKVGGGIEKCRSIVGEIIVAKMQRDNEWMKNWSVKSGIYVFDRDKLAGYVKKDLDRLNKKNQSDIQTRIDNEEKHDVEKVLDLIYDENNTNEALATLIAMLKLKQANLSDIKSFSTNGRRRYGQMFNDVQMKISA